MIELVIAMMILTVGVFGTLSMIDGANATTTTTKAREAATNLSRHLLEASRSVPYPRLTPGSVVDELQDQPGLRGNGPAHNWRISLRDVTYGVTATVCSLDDVTDGTGDRDAGSFCSDSTTSSRRDGNPDDYKRVEIELRWTANSREHSLRQRALINNPGNSVGPAVRSLTMTSPSSNPVTMDFATVDFRVNTSTTPTTVGWTIDGVPQDDALGSGTQWSFTWPVAGLEDGSYLIGSRAFDKTGASGASAALTVTLNRFLPRAPGRFLAGLSSSVVELEWLPNKERDIAGYRAYRGAPGSGILVCDLSTATACQDLAPPDGSGPIPYHVVAVDRTPNGSYREGAASTATVVRDNRPPNPARSLSATAGGDGTTTLTWSSPDPEPASGDGDDVAFYRIYRDGSAYSDRYDRTGLPTDLAYVDAATDGVSHTYYVTAVDSQLAESILLGPVER